MEVCNIVQEAVGKTISKKKKNKKAKRLFEEPYKLAEERSENQGRNGKVHPTKCRIPKNSSKKEIRRPSSMNNA